MQFDDTDRTRNIAPLLGQCNGCKLAQWLFSLRSCRSFCSWGLLSAPPVKLVACYPRCPAGPAVFANAGRRMIVANKRSSTDLRPTSPLHDARLPWRRQTVRADS